MLPCTFRYTCWCSSNKQHQKKELHIRSTIVLKCHIEEVFHMPSNKEEEFREQLKELVSEYEKKGVSIEMIIDYVNSLIKH